MRSVLAVVFLLAFAIPLAAQQPAQAGSGGATISAPALPATLGALRLSETSIYTDSLRGTHYRYVDPMNLYIDVAVHAVPAPGGMPVSASSIINRAVDGFKRLPETTVGGIPRFDIVEDSAYTLAIGSRTVPAHFVAARLQRGIQRRYEALHVFMSGRRYVRVTVNSIGTSTVPEDAPEVRRQADAFVAALIPALSAAWGL